MDELTELVDALIQVQDAATRVLLSGVLEPGGPAEDTVANIDAICRDWARDISRWEGPQ